MTDATDNAGAQPDPILGALEQIAASLERIEQMQAAMLPQSIGREVGRMVDMSRARRLRLQ
jgi:hypothetical protein